MQWAAKFRNLWRGRDPLSRMGVALHPEQLQGSQQLFPSDPIINGARQPAQTTSMAHFSIALLQCHWPSSTLFPWAGVGQESSQVQNEAVGRQPNPSRGGRRFTSLLFAPGLNPAWQSVLLLLHLAS